jgi:RsiW-degrading membrane proteinase PrsW (M82 family)
VATPTVIPKTDPRARALLTVCLLLSCGFFLAELLIFLFLDGRAAGFEPVMRVLSARARLFSLGRGAFPLYAAVGVLMHAGIAAFMGAALQRTWLRNRKLALSVVALLFVAFQGALVALAVGNP